MMVKRGLDFFYFEIEQAPSELLLTGQANSAFLADFFALGSSNSKGAWSISKINKSKLLFIIVFKSKMVNSRAEILVHL